MSSVIVGIDEVGRGPWAGPLVAAAVALPAGCRIRGVLDSKLLSAQKRMDIVPVIKRKAISVGIGWAGHDEVDGLGLTAATSLAMQRALTGFEFVYDEIVIDGNYNYLKESHELARAEIKADRLYSCVSAASIIAKVARDNFMKRLAQIYPAYGFERHVGYGTAEHKRLLIEFGPSPIHRYSFKSLRA